LTKAEEAAAQASEESKKC